MAQRQVHGVLGQGLLSTLPLSHAGDAPRCTDPRLKHAPFPYHGHLSCGPHCKLQLSIRRETISCFERQEFFPFYSAEDASLLAESWRRNQALSDASLLEGAKQAGHENPKAMGWIDTLLDR